MIGCVTKRDWGGRRGEGYEGRGMRGGEGGDGYQR